MQAAAACAAAALDPSACGRRSGSLAAGCDATWGRHRLHGCLAVGRLQLDWELLRIRGAAGERSAEHDGGLEQQCAEVSAAHG
jgi:hypothetical protein